MREKSRWVILGGETLPNEVLEKLQEVEQLLDEQHSQSALDRLKKFPGRSAWISNAIGVCQLRLHDRGALATFEQIAGDGNYLRMDVPAVFRLNLGIARLERGNLAGFLAALRTVSSSECPSVSNYWLVYRQWRRSLPLQQRFRLAVTGETDPPLQLPDPVGELH